MENSKIVKGLSEKIADLIADEIETLEESIEEHFDNHYQSHVADLENQLLELEWLELPEHPLLHHQKASIKKAIELILDGELELA